MIASLATGESEGGCSGDSVGLLDMGDLVYGGSVGGSVSVTVGDVVTIISTGARVVGETDGAIVGLDDGDFVGETVPSTMLKVDIEYFRVRNEENGYWFWYWEDTQLKNVNT